MYTVKNETNLSNTAFIKDRIIHWPFIKKTLIKDLLEQESLHEQDIIEFMQIVDEFYYQNNFMKNYFDRFLELYPSVRSKLKKINKIESDETQVKLKEFMEKIDSFWRDNYL